MGSDLCRKDAHERMKCSMPPVGSLMLGAFAVSITWTLVRVLRNRTIFSDGVA